MQPIARSSPAPTFRPPPRTAALLGLLFPGLGTLYAGRPARAAAIYVAVHLWAIALLLLTFVVRSAVLRIGLTVLMVVGAWLLSALDAARTAQHATPAPRGPLQRWYVLTTVFLLGGLGLQPRALELIKRNLAEAFKIPSGSMAPTMIPGDYVFASQRVTATPKRGAVVIYRSEGQRYTHRVVGLPGDTIEMRGFKLLINGVAAAEPYARVGPDAGDIELPELAWQRSSLTRNADPATYRPRYGTWGPLVVPAGRYFLLGDDRANSMDSRIRGFVPAGALAGRPIWIYFSRDPETGAVRWARIGRGVT